MTLPINPLTTTSAVYPLHSAHHELPGHLHAPVPGCPECQAAVQDLAWAVAVELVRAVRR